QWGMPSGHSQNAMVFWGTVAINISIKVFRVLAILLILSIGISRLYLGVHYLSQVLAGFMIGLIILYISYQYEQRFCHWVSKLHFIQKVITLFLLVHMPWLLIAAVHSVLDMGSDAQLPYNRLSFYSGILFGIALSLSTSPNGTPCSQPWKIVVLVLTKALPGFIVIYYLWQLKNQLPELLQNVSTPSLHYVAFWLLGLCISLWACWLWPTIHKYFFRNNCLYPEN
ncbi:MAG: phosphatase PAP2 family protein, partial [Endozoicomonas sp.]